MSDRINSFFDSEAARYDRAYDNDGPKAYEVISRQDVAVRMLGDPAGRALDLGMGGGRLCEELHRRGWDIWGVDPSAEMVALAKRRLPALADCFQQARAEELPFPDASFHAVVLTGVLEYIDDHAAAVRELLRVLQPSGVVVIGTANGAALPVIWRQRVYFGAIRLIKSALTVGRPAPVPKRMTTPRRLHALLAAEGAVIEEIAHTSFLVLPSPLDWLFPHFSVRLARQLERKVRRPASIVATQIVVRARKL